MEKKSVLTSHLLCTFVKKFKSIILIFFVITEFYSLNWAEFEKSKLRNCIVTLFADINKSNAGLLTE